jgi:Ca-activated chloride channel family protein
MKLGAVFLILVGTVAGAIGQEGQNDAADQTPRFAVNVDMVSMSLTVFDENGKLVTDLEKEDFTVYEDGVEQELRVFSREDLPLRMIILLDTSSSMRIKMEMAQDAAIEFVQSLKPGDRIKVIEFNDRVLNLIDFTENVDEVAAAIRTTVADGATALHNAIYISLQSLSRRRQGDERQAVVVLSDGADTRSLVTFEDVRESARKTDVTIYAISLRGTEKDLKKNKYLEAKYVLEKLATESGGSSFSPEQIKDLAGVYDQIAAELKSQYNLGYISTNAETDGAWRRIQVRCNRPGLEVRTRNGYYAPRRRARSRN